MNKSTDTWTPDYGNDPDWYVNADGHRYKAKPKNPSQTQPSAQLATPCECEQRSVRHWVYDNGPHVVSTFIWCMLLVVVALVFAGVLSRPEPKYQPIPVVEVDCKTGEFMTWQDKQHRDFLGGEVCWSKP